MQVTMGHTRHAETLLLLLVLGLTGCAGELDDPERFRAARNAAASNGRTDTGTAAMDTGMAAPDATGMAEASQIVRIGVGMDAAEVAFLSSFGPISLIEKSVNVSISEA